MPKLFIKIKRTKEAGFFDPDRLSLIRSALLGFLKFFISVVAILSLVAFIVEHGFYIGEELRSILTRVPGFALYGFSFYYLFRVILEKERIRFIKSHRLELFLISLITFYLLFPGIVQKIVLSINPLLKPETLTVIYLVVTQTLALLALVVEGLNQTKKIMYLNIQPSMLLLLSFLILITVGTLLLMLPKATLSRGMNPVDALFTAASAVTVTGLTVVDTQAYFTFTGKLIILVLIQLGGLGIMTLTSFFAFTSGKFYNLKEYIAIQEILGEENIGGVKKFIRQVVVTTFLIEIIGAVLIFISLAPGSFSSTAEKVFFSIFHSVSAFCNAGFSIMSENLSHPAYALNVSFLIIISCLIICGGIGFPVLRDIGRYVKIRTTGKIVMRFQLHTKIVLITTGLLILCGMVLFSILEWGNVVAGQSFFDKLLTSFFQSVTTRTAGFNTVDIGRLTSSTIFIFIILMWIGASPASTGGGIKTTTFSISLLNLFAISKGKSSVELFKKKISDSDISKAFSTIVLSMIYIAIVVFTLSLSENFGLEKIIFEVVSATSTVGLSTGITPYLSNFGKIVLVFSMFVGRIGFLTFTFALFKKKVIHNYDYIEERIII